MMRSSSSGQLGLSTNSRHTSSILKVQWMDLHELKILLSHMPRSKGIFPDYHVISQCQENVFNKFMLI